MGGRKQALQGEDPDSEVLAVEHATLLKDKG